MNKTICYSLLALLTMVSSVSSAASLLTNARVGVSRGGDGTSVIDCNKATAWNSGGYAPADIFFEIRKNTKPISIIRLTPAQSPAGKTTHEIFVSDAGNNWRSVDEILEEFTQDGVPLVRTFDPPLTGVKKIKVVTKSSPSWVAWYDIEAYSSEKEMARGCSN